MRVTMHIQGNTEHFHTMAEAVAAFRTAYAEGLPDGTKGVIHGQSSDCSATTCLWTRHNVVEARPRRDGTIGFYCEGRTAESPEENERRRAAARVVDDEDQDDEGDDDGEDFSECATAWCSENSEGGEGYDGFCGNCADCIQGILAATPALEEEEDWDGAVEIWTEFETEEDADRYLEPLWALLDA